MNLATSPSAPFGKTVITGISGFIAGNLAKALAADGIEVIGIGRNSPRADVLEACRFASCDLRNFEATAARIAAHRPKTVFHLAAYSVLTAGQDEGARGMLDANVGGTWNLLEACRRADVACVVIASSDKQYGSLATPPYDDEDTTAFLNGGLYELSKAQQDQIARVYAGMYDTPSIRIARLINIYGPGDTQWTRIVPGTIRRTVRGEPARITSGRAGEALREYLYVDDCIAALRALGEDAFERGNAPLRREDGKLARVGFNITSGHRFAAGEAIGRIQRILNDEFGVTGPPPEILPGAVGVWEPGSQFGKVERLAQLLPGWAPRSFEAGLRATIPWYLDHLRTQV